MKRMITETNYEKLLPILNLVPCIGDYVKLKSSPYMDLIIEKLPNNDDNDLYSLGHYYIQNFDVMSDPQMTIKVNHEHKMAFSNTYELSSLGIYQRTNFIENGKTYINPKLQKELNSFLSKWLKNIKDQKFIKNHFYLYSNENGIKKLKELTGLKLRNDIDIEFEYIVNLKNELLINLYSNKNKNGFIIILDKNKSNSLVDIKMYTNEQYKSITETNFDIDKLINNKFEKIESMNIKDFFITS